MPDLAASDIAAIKSQLLSAGKPQVGMSGVLTLLASMSLNSKRVFPGCHQR